MQRRNRSSFAARLLAAGLVLSIAIIGGVSSFLLISRDRQTRTGALSNSDNRAAVMRQVLDRFTGTQSAAAAAGLASQPAVATALQNRNAALAVSTLFALTPIADLSGEELVVSDAVGRVVLARPAPDLGKGGPIDLSPPSLAAARIPGRAARCDLVLANGGQAPGVCGVELLAGAQPSYDVAVPVVAGGRTVGVVAYLAPLAAQLERFRELFQFPTAFIETARSETEVRSHAGRDDLGSTDPGLASAIDAGGNDVVHGIYRAPTASGTTEDVAGSFVAVRGLDHQTTVGYIGVEAPLSLFVGDTRTDELTLIAIAVLFLLITAIGITVFVNRFVRRPVAQLAQGVSRIAGGDYGTPVRVRSRDELGSLAADVNRMRDNIAAYLGEIRQARMRLDSAVARMTSVSHTLTLTTRGIPALEQEVVRTARAIAGDQGTAVLAVAEGGTLVNRVTEPAGAPASLSEASLVRELLAGRASRTAAAAGPVLAVPLFYQERVVGALAVVGAASPPLGDDEERVLTVLANNAAVALENTRLFEQERETVRRLRELDAMKTDFLSTVQHELRTPLTAILGLADLMEMCWDTWTDEPKLDAVRDIQVAARNLHAMVETIIDYALLDAEAMRLEVGRVTVRPAIDSAIRSLSERRKGGISARIDVEGDVTVAIRADSARFEEVMRALLDNAVKFNRKDNPIRIVVMPRGSRVEIEIIDQGIGIAEDELPKIFDRFYQVDSTATRRTGGTGMGLALVRRLAEVHGAEISVESVLGRGTRFTLRWPADGG